MSTMIPLAPIVEEIANRWGFFDVKHDGVNQPLSLPAEALERFNLYGEKLQIKELARLLPEHVVTLDNAIIFPLTIEAKEAADWRFSIREFFRLLAEENPAHLGRRELTVWDKPRTPAEGIDHLPLSQRFLERSYLGEFIVREKKSLVVDYRRCQRNYLASVDVDGRAPAVLLMDASSQIASHLLGFNGLALWCVLAHPESFQNLDYRDQVVPAEQALKALLLRWAPPGLNHIAWCNSGTEAWEKALHLSQVLFPNRGNKCVCFKGSFHGRTLISLFSSWNPVKRLPFQLEGFETLWAEFPEDKEPHIVKRAESAWLDLWSNAHLSDFSVPLHDLENDPLLLAEAHSLLEVRRHCLDQAVCSVSVEPMQCEGGDRFASDRFFQALRVLTKSMGVALIMDEVQSGFGLGGAELWTSLFELRTATGQPLSPDFIVLAKKCQVAAVLSCVPDVFPTSAHAASFCRGYVNATAIDSDALTALGDRVRERLFAVTAPYSFVEWPRAQGLAFAFDLPDGKYANNFVNQRFYHGFMVYIAGDRTLRFRIQHTTSDADLDHIFDSIKRSLDHLASLGPDVLPEKYDYVWPDIAGPDLALPTNVSELRSANWDLILKTFGELSSKRRQELAELLEPKPIEQHYDHHKNRRFTWLEFLRYLAGRQSIRIRPLTKDNWGTYADAIMELERLSYEPARVDEESFLQAAVSSERSVCFVAFEKDRLLGFCIAAPLEHFSQVRGPDSDPGLKSGKYLYSADLLVHPDAHGRGVGYRLKACQVEAARALGYWGIRSRNRVDRAGAMEAINRSFGGIEINYFEKDYGSDEAPCRYLNIPLQQSASAKLRWSSGVDNPTGGLLEPERWVDWDLAAINKNSLCNWWTPNMTRYVEWLRMVSPLGHVYLASGRDEAVDKLVKCLIYRRKGAQTMLSFEGSFWGGVTAAARSLSDAKFGHHFPWKQVSYPYQEGDPFAGLEDALTHAEVDTLDQLGQHLESPDQVLGVAIEPIQEMSGRRVSVRFLRALRALCDDAGVPLVMNESASWAYRGSRELFYCQATGVEPDVLTAFGGGQLGHVFCNDKYYIETPLTLISTWDGDELSALRFRAQMEILRAFRDDERLLELDRMVGSRGDLYRGSGVLYFDGEELDCRPDLAGDGHVFMPPLNRLEEGWEVLTQLFSRHSATAVV